MGRLWTRYQVGGALYRSADTLRRSIHRSNRSVNMNMEKSIKAAITYAGLSQADVARALGMSTSNFSQRITGRGFKDEELARIADAIGAKVDFRFEFPDGTRI
jgi:predicted XRE-type DNA-binding protein